MVAVVAVVAVVTMEAAGAARVAGNSHKDCPWAPDPYYYRCCSHQYLEQ